MEEFKTETEESPQLPEASAVLPRWPGAQSIGLDVNVAKAMFAMTSPVASRIAAITLQQVKVIALSNTQKLRVRWDGDLEFWRDLLIPYVQEYVRPASGRQLVSKRYAPPRMVAR